MQRRVIMQVFPLIEKHNKKSERVLLGRFLGAPYRLNPFLRVQLQPLLLKANSHYLTRHRQRCLVVSGGRCELGIRSRRL